MTVCIWERHKIFTNATQMRTTWSPHIRQQNQPRLVSHLQHALETAGSTDTEAVRQALLDMDIMTFYGAINFDETGKNAAHAMAAGQIIDDQFQIVYPLEAAVQDFVYPDPSCE